jgi:hypothetical protein
LYNLLVAVTLEPFVPQHLPQVGLFDCVLETAHEKFDPVAKVGEIDYGRKPTLAGEGSSTSLLPADE